MEEQQMTTSATEPMTPARETKLMRFKRHRYYFYLPLIAVFGMAAALAYAYSVSKTPTDLPLVNHHQKAVKLEVIKWENYKYSPLGFEFAYPDGMTVEVTRPNEKNYRFKIFSSTSEYDIFITSSKFKSKFIFPPSGEIVELPKKTIGNNDWYLWTPRDGGGGEYIEYKMPLSSSQTISIYFPANSYDEAANPMISSLYDNEDLIEAILEKKYILAEHKEAEAQMLTENISTTTTLDTLAKCLNEKQATMYGASWCPHCQNEKKSFGAAWQYVPYVECVENPDACQAAGITGYPTWVLKNGQKLFGEQNGDGYKKLAEATGCPAPEITNN